MVPPKPSVTGDYYARVIKSDLMRAVKRKRPDLIRSGFILHHDNAPSHKSRVVMDTMETLGIENLIHPPYSPDCDVLLFPVLKDNLRGEKYESLEDLEKIYNDCSEILKRNPSRKGKDGVYVIYPDRRREVYCDMTTDGGGWTVIQKREDGDVDFYKTWIEYQQGFGNATKNYWIGNDAIHTLTRDKDQELRIDLQRHNGEQAYAVYSTFYIEDEDNEYTLTVSGYSGTA
ncbi:fibroleukin-like, partial [Saccostrea cucullata]|uniref:fibroleukin-like n=1 Tax=Saccostrea cuccullata TaxID=36930 RepID=UPI002ED65499